MTSFSAGELSPKLLGRTDLKKYAGGCQKLENFITAVHGGITRRPGTRFVADVKTQAMPHTRLVEFAYSTAQTYVLEFGHEYIRFFRDKGQLVFAGVPTEIESPYADEHLAEIKYTQSADILYLTHPLYAPMKLKRTAGDDADPDTWELVEFVFKDGPYLEINDTSITLTPTQASGGNETITASAALFVSTDVGRLIRLSNPASGEVWGWARILTVTDSTHVQVEIEADFAQAAVATKVWRLGAWYVDNYPKVSQFHQERLWFGGTYLQPQTLWGSRVGNFQVFTPSKLSDATVRDDDGVTYTISDNQVNAIWWIKSDAKGLLVLTDSGEFIGQASGAFDPISPTNFSIFRQSNHGSHQFVRPHQIASVLLFAHSAGRKIRELVFNFETDKFLAPDMTRLSDHITLGGLRDSAYQQEPDSILWLVRNDGQLLGLTYERNEEVVAWHRHPPRIGDAVESCACIRDDDKDVLWLIVKRIIDGDEHRYVEHMEDPFDFDVEAADGLFLDCASSGTPGPSGILSGLDYLAGETVGIVADGADEPDQIVTADGKITLESRSVPAETVHVGLRYTSRVITMPLVPPAGSGGDPRGKMQRVNKFFLQIHRSSGGNVGFASEPSEPGSVSPDYDLDEVIYRTPQDAMDLAIPLKTGLFEQAVTSASDRQQSIVLEARTGMPMTILAILAEMTVD